MYEKLLLNCDGGIIDVAKQSEQDNCAVLCIGLGGSGVATIKNLKAKVYNRVQPDDKDAVVPSYHRYKYLAVDTDKAGLVRANELSADISKIDLDTEFFDISSNRNISDLFKDNSAAIDAKPQYKEWLRHKEIKVLSAKAGAGGVRQMGRYLFMEHAGEFVEKVRSLIVQAKTDEQQPKTYVHIFSGMGGGTGAGILLDVCYLVQEALRLEEIEGFVCGYCFLPDVNIAVGLPREVAAYVQVNGYATMQELDYLMNIERNGDVWEQNYGELGLIHSEKPPFDICHLVTARNAKGDVIKDAFNYAINVVTDYFMDFIVKTDNDFTMESHISNYDTMREQIYKEHGALYEYCVLGASNARLPYKEVLTYLASEMFARFANIRKIVPTKADVDNFVLGNGLSYDQIYDALVAECDLTFPHSNVRWQDAKGNDNLTVTWFTDMRAEAEGKCAKNYSALSRELDGYDPIQDSENQSRSIIGKIYTSLRTIAVNANMGPHYASAILGSLTGIDLIAVISGHITQVKSEQSQEAAQTDKLRKDWEQSQRDFFENSGTFSGKAKYAKYRSLTRELVLNYTRLSIYDYMFKLLSLLREQLVNLKMEFFEPFKVTVDNLIDTFAENRSYLEINGGKVNDFEIPLAKIKDLKPNLDATIRDINMKVKTADFLNHMLSREGMDAWLQGNENKIYKVVNNYFTTLFSDYSKKTMTSYLQERYNTTNSEKLIKCIKDDILNDLSAKATPLFWTASVYNVDKASRIGYITFPAVSEEVKQAAFQLSDAKATGEIKPRSSHIQDRISIMRCLVGVPMFGYQGLLQYENNSVLSSTVGKHIYEGKSYKNDDGEDVTGRDWRYLPSPSPYSLMNRKNCENLKKKADTANKLYETAEANKIISQIDENNYGIYIIDDSFMRELRRIRDNALGKTKVEMLEAASTIKEMLKDVKYRQDRLFIPNDAAPSLPEVNKRQVRIDHFVSSPKLQFVVDNEVEKHEEIENALIMLEPKEDEQLVEFQNALFTGQIVFVPPIVECEDSFGMKYKLSSPDMLRGGVPLYQSFLSFKTLDAEVRDEIRQASNEALTKVPLDQKAVDAARAVQAELIDIKLMVQEAAEMFPDELSVLKKFLTGMQDSLSRFARRYRIDLK